MYSLKRYAFHDYQMKNSDESQLRRNYNNFRMSKPVEHCWYYSSYLLNPFQWTPEEKILELDGGLFLVWYTAVIDLHEIGITLDDVQVHKEALLSKLKIEALVTGNFEQNVCACNDMLIYRIC
jgi:secreted Zn-dependent insulinase-like peptidase